MQGELVWLGGLLIGIAMVVALSMPRHRHARVWGLAIATTVFVLVLPIARGSLDADSLLPSVVCALAWAGVPYHAYSVDSAIAQLHGSAWRNGRTQSASRRVSAPRRAAGETVIRRVAMAMLLAGIALVATVLMYPSLLGASAWPLCLALALSPHGLRVLQARISVGSVGTGPSGRNEYRAFDGYGSVSVDLDSVEPLWTFDGRGVEWLGVTSGGGKRLTVFAASPTHLWQAPRLSHRQWALVVWLGVAPSVNGERV